MRIFPRIRPRPRRAHRGPDGPDRPLPDHSGWFHEDPVEGFRVLPTPDQTTHAGYRWSRTVGTGYRWDTRSARSGCEPGGPPSDVVADPSRARPDDSTPTLVGTEMAPALPGDSISGRWLPTARTERALMAIAARTHELAGAVSHLEARLDDMNERLVDVVTHHDLVETESRRARLAAEVSRLSVELKAELDRRLSDLGRALAVSNGRSATVNHRGSLDLADEQRVIIQSNHVEARTKVAHLSERQTA